MVNVSATLFLLYPPIKVNPIILSRNYFAEVKLSYPTLQGSYKISDTTQYNVADIKHKGFKVLYSFKKKEKYRPNSISQIFNIIIISSKHLNCIHGSLQLSFRKWPLGRLCHCIGKQLQELYCRSILGTTDI